RCDLVDGIYPAPDPIDPADNEACIEALDAIGILFDQETSITQRISKHDLEIAKIRRNGLRAWQEEIFYQESDLARSFQARDDAMASTIQALPGLLFRGEPRIAVWAHNAHLAKDGTLYYNGYTDMGSLLAAALGDSYRALALTASETDID